MTQYCKVGFHGGSSGNHTGIGDYMRTLDEAGVPFCLKSVNNVGLAVEAAQHAWQSGVSHRIILRWTNPGVPPGPEVPDYHLSPEEAANEHWQLVQQSIAAAPELEPFKHLVWLETINEPRTAVDASDPNFEEMHPADWLGWFAHFFGRLVNGAGYKWAAFGMNSGTPEPLDWKRPGMVQYLRDCAERPDMLAVALHEYTFTLDGRMAAMYPHLIGRFIWLYTACDQLGIARPTTLITESGWTYDKMPNIPQAMEDVRWYSELVAHYPTIQGVYLWTLEGTSPLPDKLQRLITPLTQYALQVRFPDPAPPPHPKGRGRPRIQYERTYVLLPPTADSEWARAVMDATWDEKRYTVGNSADDAGIGDLDMKRVIAINPDVWGTGEDGSGLRGFFQKYYPHVRYKSVTAASPAALRHLLASPTISDWD